MTGSDDRPSFRRLASADHVERGVDEQGRPRPTPLSPGSAAEPLTYQTVQRAPSQPEPRFRPRRSAQEREQIDESSLPPTQALPTQDLPQYRHRDYSPEGRRAVPSWAPVADESAGGSEERLDYRTLTRAEVRAASERYGARPGAAEAGSAAAYTGAAGSAGPVDSSSPSGAEGSGTSGDDEPRSTPEQPLTRRQLRALREAQEAAETTDAIPVVAEPERPAARPWAPVFYGEPVNTGAPAEAETAAEPEAQLDAEAQPEAEAQSEPEAAQSEPETRSEPEVVEAEVVEAAPADLAEPAAAAPTSEGLPAWAGNSPATFAIPIITETVERALDAVPPAIDDAPAAEVPTAAEPESAPVDVVPETEPETSGPSVFERLFTPPAESEAPAASVSAPPAAEAPRIADPLAFLDAAPAAADRIDLPAPGAAPVPFLDPPVVGQPPVEPPGAREEPLEVEAVDVPAARVEDVHPVVVDIEPLPAEPLPAESPAAEPRSAEPLVPPRAEYRDPTPSGTVPVGHWTTQAAVDDAVQADSLAGRDLGGGHGVVTTNALVLPSIPTPELGGSLASTGEILITGSIDLPRSLSSTGAHPTQLDQSSLDHELDPGDHQVVSVDSQPVRAIKAVSSNTSTRGMMTSSKPRGNRGLTVLIIVTAGLALVVVGVLVAGVINHAF